MNHTALVSIILFAVTYIALMAFQKYRPYIAMGSAVLFVVLGAIPAVGLEYSFLDATRKIDWNVVMMIAGTMGTVFLFIESKMPQLMSDKIISKMPNIKWAVVSISLFAGIVSAFVDNVATVLMIAPVALAICKKLDISPVPSVICIAISSNLQGAATLVGDTTAILLGKGAGIDFADFFFENGKPGMFFVTEAGAFVSMFILLFLFRKENHAINVQEITKVEDKFPTFLLLGTIASLIAVSFIPYQNMAQPGQLYKPDVTNGLICIAFFLLGVCKQCLGKKKNPSVVKAALKDIDYATIILLVGLFIVIGGIESAGIVDIIGAQIAKFGSGDSGLFAVFTIIVFVSVLLSAFIDNIPYVATMLPIIPVIVTALDAGFNGGRLLYYGLLVGATLGGNLTPIGASANVTGIGILRKEGHTVKNATFMKYSIPFTLSAVFTGYILLWLIWK